MSRFEFYNRICKFSLVLEVRSTLAFSKKIWMLHKYLHLVTHNWCSSHLFKKFAILYNMARVLPPCFLEIAKFSLSPKTNDNLHIFFSNSHLLIALVESLVELEWAEFFDY